MDLLLLFMPSTSKCFGLLYFHQVQKIDQNEALKPTDSLSMCLYVQSPHISTESSLIQEVPVNTSAKVAMSGGMMSDALPLQSASKTSCSSTYNLRATVGQMLISSVFSNREIS